MHLNIEEMSNYLDCKHFKSLIKHKKLSLIRFNDIVWIIKPNNKVLT